MDRTTDFGPGEETVRTRQGWAAFGPHRDGSRWLSIRTEGLCEKWCVMPIRVSRLFVLVGAALLMNGCDLLESSSSKAAVSPTAISKPSTAANSRSTRAGANSRQSTVAARGDKAQTAVSTQEGTKPTDASKEEGDSQAERNSLNLVGLDQTQVAQVLGPPMSETDKAPGKVWRYWNSRCTVDVSLYLDVHSRAYRVLAYEVTNHDYSAGGRGKCLAELPKSTVQPASSDGQ